MASEIPKTENRVFQNAVSSETLSVLRKSSSFAQYSCSHKCLPQEFLIAYTYEWMKWIKNNKKSVVFKINVLRTV
jgi:hypothetical protein